MASTSFSKLKGFSRTIVLRNPSGEEIEVSMRAIRADEIEDIRASIPQPQLSSYVSGFAGKGPDGRPIPQYDEATYRKAQSDAQSELTYRIIAATTDLEFSGDTLEEKAKEIRGIDGWALVALSTEVSKMAGLDSDEIMTIAKNSLTPTF